MANRGQAQYLRIFDSTPTTLYRWQSYYIGQDVTWDSATWSYQPFVANGLVGGTAGTDVGVTIEIPATALAVSVFEAALANAHLVELKIYEFDSRLTNTAPQSAQLLIGSFVGEVVTVGGSFSLLTIGLGSSLAPTGAQAPPRKFNSILVGAPIRL